MKPYFDRAGIKLYHADMLQAALPPFSAHVFITDPPYSRAGAVHTGRSSVQGSAADTAGSDQFWLHWFSAVANRVVGYTRESGCGFIFCDYRTIHLIERGILATDSGWTVSQCIVWDRESIGLGSPFRASHELIAFCRGPSFKYDGPKNIANVIRSRWPYGEHEHHPAEKPVGVMRPLIEATTRDLDVIFDPFAGSGSTLVAAHVTGRRAVGVEVEEAHCRTAATRLSQYVLPLEAAAGA